MAYAGKIIEGPDTGVRFRESARETDGELLRFEQFVQKDHTPIPAYVHGSQEERFVLSGRMGVRAAGKESVLGPGEEVAGPPGMPHAFWNASEGDKVLHHTVELRPAKESEAFPY